MGATPASIAPMRSPNRPATTLDDLWSRWFGQFVGTGQVDGWLDHVDLSEARIREQLGGDFQRNITALCWLAIRPGVKRRERVISWEPHSQAAFDKDLIEVDGRTIYFLRSSGHALDRDGVDNDLPSALDIIDDELWCERKATALALTQLALTHTIAGQRPMARVTAGRVDAPLTEPRIPGHVGAVRQYRSIDAVILFGTNPDWRVAVSTGDPIAYKAAVHAPVLESSPLE